MEQLAEDAKGLVIEDIEHRTDERGQVDPADQSTEESKHKHPIVGESSVVYAIKQRNKELPDENHQMVAIQETDGVLARLIRAVRLGVYYYFATMFQTTPMLVVVTIFMGVYYVPAIVMQGTMSHFVSWLLYDLFRRYIRIFYYYVSMCMMFVEVFSMEFSKRAIVLVVTPCIWIDFALCSITERDNILINIGGSICTFLVGTLSFYVISKNEVKNEPTTALQDEYFSLTKDGTPKAMIKGLVGVYALIGFFFQYFFPVFTRLSSLNQAICRLLVFPLIFFVSKTYQNYVIFDLSSNHIQKRLIINRASNIFIKFSGRIALSNISSDGSNLTFYIAVNILVAIIDIVTDVSLRNRIQLIYKLNILFSNKSNRRRTKRVVSIIPGDGAEELQSQESLIDKSFHMRNQLLFYDISSEILVVVAAPLLMYFMHPIYPETSLNTISNINECLFQILMQLIFVSISNMISLSYDFFEGNIKLDEPPIPIKLKNMSITACFTIFSVIYTHYLVSQV